VLAIALMFASVAVSAVTWAQSAPDQALYLARGMALDGSDVRNYLKYPEQAIRNAPVVFPFQQNLAPQLFQTIAYRQGGQAKQSSFDDFLKATQTTSLIVVRDGTVPYEGYANGYPIGLDKVKIGDPKSKVAESYRGASIEETGRTIIVKHASEVFLNVRFRHSSNRSTEGKIDNIEFDLGTFERIRNNSLPKVPESWLHDSLRKVLGEPMLVGEDNKCLLWKTAANEPVYYLLEADSFEISGYVNYPPGCYVSKEQVQKQTKARQ
jgi:hypothetical protein